jgi:protein arginine N-methyltransferase 5
MCVLYCTVILSISAENSLTSPKYDMLTAPITNDAFHSKVLQVLSDHIGALGESETPLRSIAGQADVPAPPLLPSLTPADTLLGPDEAIGQLILTTSTWIELASPDPLIAEISRQVLALEISYASFCGATNVLIQGPAANASSQDGLMQYSHALVEVMGLANYLQFHIAMPMTGQASTDHAIGDLANLARDEYVDDLGLDDDDEAEEDGDENKEEVDDFGSWDVWNVIRSTCRYSPRVSVGKNANDSCLPIYSLVPCITALCLCGFTNTLFRYNSLP